MEAFYEGSLIGLRKKGLAANSANAAFTAAQSKATITEPAASATRTIIGTGLAGGYKQGVTIKVKPFGRSADNNTIKIKVQGWSRVQEITGAPSVEWVSSIVAEVLATLSSSLPGIAGMAVTDSDLFADTLATTNGFAILHQGASNVDSAFFECDVTSYEYVEILYALGTGSEANCLWNF